MNIIGLHNDEDSGVCLLQNGILVEAVNEERFNRIKLYKGFPALSLTYVLSKYGLKVDDIDWFAYGWYGLQNHWQSYIQKLANRIIKGLKANPYCGDLIEERLRSEIEQDAATRASFESRMSELGVPAHKIAYLDHHQSHAWSAFACSPFDEAIVFSFDGRGDLKSSSVSYASSKEGLIERDYQLTFDSLGYLYGQITKYCGFTPHRHEGKVTGLAAYGNAQETLPFFNKLISWEDNEIHAHLGTYRPFFNGIHPDLANELAKFKKEDVAAGVQAHCENLVVQSIKHGLASMPKPNVRNVCLAGGLFANVKINQRVAEIDGVDRVFVFPHMGDGGLTVGSACFLNFRLTGHSKMSMPTVYLGPGFSSREISEVLSQYAERIDYEKTTDKVDRTVKDLIDKKVVGYFDGRMEFGPRSLGARSILHHACDASVNDWLNKRFNRTEFMPFAPVSTADYAPQCYKDWNKDDVCAKFMTRTFDCFADFSKMHKAVVHIDGTARPQVVTEADNRDYYRIVKTYCERTGEKALINTSFNKHEEPIVCSPEDAIRCLIAGTIDVLIIGEYRAVKRGA